jgi:hypothetical protein
MFLCQLKIIVNGSFKHKFYRLLILEMAIEIK